MKYCVNCKKSYTDDKVFCSVCGSRLIEEPVSNPNMNGSGANKICSYCGSQNLPHHAFCSTCGKSFVSNGTNVNNASQVNTNATQNNGMNAWLSVILAGIGALIGWYNWGLFGFVLGMSGIAFATNLKKQGQIGQLPFVITIVLAVIDTIFWIMYSIAK